MDENDPTAAELELKLLRHGLSQMHERDQLAVLACAEELRYVVARYASCGQFALLLMATESQAADDNGEAWPRPLYDLKRDRVERND